LLSEFGTASVEIEFKLDRDGGEEEVMLKFPKE